MQAYSKLLGGKVTRNDPIFDRVVDISPDGRFLTLGNQGVRLEGDKLVETFYENMAAQITKHNIPNYEYVGEFIKTLRDYLLERLLLSLLRLSGQVLTQYKEDLENCK